MSYLVALVVLLALMCTLNLLLTVGLIRRMRQQSEPATGRTAAPHRGRRAVIAEGETAAPFRAVCTDGSEVSLDLARRPMLVGFFSPGCTACHEATPGFVAMARRVSNASVDVLAVVLDEGGEPGPQAEEFQPVAGVVVEKLGGAVSSALQVTAYPAFALLDQDGRIMASGSRLDEVLVSASA